MLYNAIVNKASYTTKLELLSSISHILLFILERHTVKRKTLIHRLHDIWAQMENHSISLITHSRRHFV